MVLGCGGDIRQQVISQPVQTSSTQMCLFCLEALPAEVLRSPLHCSPSVNPPIPADRTQNRSGLVAYAGPQRRSAGVIRCKCLLEAGESAGGRGNWVVVAAVAVDSPPRDAGTQAPPPSSQSPAICFSILELIIALHLQ